MRTGWPGILYAPTPPGCNHHNWRLAMLQRTRKARYLAYPLVLAFLMVGFAAQTAAAGVVGTDTVLAEQAGSEHAAISSFMNREDVQQQLVDYGVSPEEAQERIASLTPEEMMDLGERIDSLPAGASGTVVLLLVLIIVILLVR